jgi:hypothetical protein
VWFCWNVSTYCHAASRVANVLLEIVQSFLPTSITLDPYFDTSKYHLLPTPEIDTKLDYIAVIDGPWLALNTWRA